MAVVETALLLASLTADPTSADHLSRNIVESGLKQAGCTLPVEQAEVVGTRPLAGEIKIAEVRCWRAHDNEGSIFFAFPVGRPQSAHLLKFETWRNQRIELAYSISSPEFDHEEKTLSSFAKGRGMADCGTIAEWKWTGWHFSLQQVWAKPECDGVPFGWDNLDGRQVFPARP
jgi:hypothetical protein